MIALSTDQSTIQTYLHNVYNNEQIKKGPNKRNQIPTLSSITATGNIDNPITPNAGQLKLIASANPTQLSRSINQYE